MLRLLGEVSAECGGRPVDLGAPRQRCVLAALAVDAGRAVPLDRLVERVWGAEPPRARTTLHSYVSRLRRALAESGGLTIVRRSGGYVLTVDGTVDLLRFRELRDLARADEADAVRWLTEALALWRGEALTGLDGEWVRAERDRLAQERLAAEHELIDARLRAGDGGELVAELSARAADHPLDERVVGQYLLALHRAGRTTDALEHYQRVRARLVEELGAEPGAALQELHQQILAADPQLIAIQASTPMVPRQLPAAPASFAGRLDELRRLDTLLAAGTVGISAIVGTGGMGKTCLALHWAHRNAGRFTDGHLFVNLRGFSPTEEPMDAGEALGGLLHALDVDPGRVPAGTQARSALFRSLVAGKRLLLVLDNAASTDQIVPLLPGTDRCTVLVTSRNRLPGLVTRHGAQHLPLGELTDAEARALLTDRLGAARVEADEIAVGRMIALCGGFPLALGIIAAHAQTRPGLSLAALAEELRDAATRLDVLDSEDSSASLPAVLSWSLRTLSPQQRDAFALLSIAPGPDLGLAAAINLIGTTPATTRQLLRALEAASLLHEDVPGRWRMHDLVRAYATTVAQDLPGRLLDDALQRVIDYYTHTARAADLLLSPATCPDPVDLPASEAVHVQQLPDDPAAQAWFTTEFACLLAVQHAALTHHRYAAAWLLAWHTNTFTVRRNHAPARLVVWQIAEEAATHLPGPLVRAQTERMLGSTYFLLGRHEMAMRHLHQALALAEQLDDLALQATIHYVIAYALGTRDDRLGLEHALRALALYRSVGDEAWEARALAEAGWLSAFLGQFEEARDFGHAALTLSRKLGDPISEATVSACLGHVARLCGDHEEAIDHLNHSVALARELGHFLGIVDALERIGHPYAALGRRSQAQAAWREALELFQERGLEAEAARIQGLLDELECALTS